MRDTATMFAPTGSSRGARAQEGQSLVEVAISFSLLVLLLGGLVDLGRAFFIFIALEDAAGEAALFAPIEPDCPYEWTVGRLSGADRPELQPTPQFDVACAGGRRRACRSEHR